MAESKAGPERRPVNSHATVHIGKDRSGEDYNVYDEQGNLIKEEATVAPQGTIYVGAGHAGSEVLVEKA